MSLLSLFSPFAWIKRIVSLVIIAIVVYLAWSAYLVIDRSRIPTGVTTVRQSAAIVVLGAPVIHGVVGPDLAARLHQAVILYEAQKAPRIIVAGSGLVPGLASSWLIAHGVPPASVEMAPGGSPLSELTAAGDLIAPRRDVVVVTDALDALWVDDLAHGAGLKVQVSPAVGSEVLATSQLGLLWVETSAVAVGRIVGYTRIGWGEG